MFEQGKVYHRRIDLHDKYGGNRQSGIASCADFPYIFLFFAPSAKDFGYKDAWLSNEEFLYTGEGQYGNMEFSRGNLLVRDHAARGKRLYLFEYCTPGEYRCLGEFEYRSHEIQRGKDALGKERQVIRFRLGRVHPK